MKKIKSFFKSKTFGKIFAITLIFAVLVSSFVISSSASVVIGYQSIDPINIYNYGGDVTVSAFPGPHTVSIYYQASGSFTTYRTYLNNDDYFNDENTHLKIKSLNNTDVVYFQMALSCNYSTILVNGSRYPGSSTTLGSSITANLFDVTEFISSPVSSTFDSSTTYYYMFDIILSNYSEIEQARQDGYNQGYSVGFEQGYTNGTGSQVVQNARDEGYRDGYAAGRESTDSGNLGENLLGDTLSAPMDALNDFTLYESSSGFNVTLGLVVGGAICLTLLIAFLKIFAGG